MSRVLAIAASARRNGNSDTLLEKALEPIRRQGASVEIVSPHQLSVTPCRSCGACWKTGRCVINDVMQEMYVKCCDVDHILVASPIYFTSLPGHFKLFIDRFQCFWARTFLLGDPPQPHRSGAFICVGAMERERHFKNALSIVRTWMLTLNMKCKVTRFCPGLDGTDEVLTRQDYLEAAFEVGRRLLASPEQ